MARQPVNRSPTTPTGPNHRLRSSDPPVSIGEGDGLAYQCAWNNTTDKAVGFGEGFNEEMCFLWAYYYPSKGFDICFDNLCPNR